MRVVHCMLCLVCLTMALACGDAGETKPDPAPEPAPPAAEPAPEPAPEPTPVDPTPAAAETSGPGDPVAGEMSYKLFCATCHGEDGCSVGPGAAGLDPKPAMHCDGTYMNALSDDHLFKVIKEGGAAVGKSPLMAPWGGALSDEQIWDVVAYLRSIADPPYEPSS